MNLTRKMMDRFKTLAPGWSGDRIVLDPRGIHHKTTPSRDFEHAVGNHADLRKRSIAESLYLVERLRDEGIVPPGAKAWGQGAVVQAFRATAGREACHSMPCQLVLNGQFPHNLPGPNGTLLNYTYIARCINLFARCMIQEKIVNAIDSVLDWHPGTDLQGKYVDAVQSVLDGQDARGAYLDHSHLKRHLLTDLLEQVKDQPITVYDAMLLTGALTPSPDGSPAPNPKELERLLTDKEAIGRLQSQRVLVVETYADSEVFTPHEVVSGELKDEIRDESWT